VDLLLARGAEAGRKDDRGKTAADQAAESGHAALAAKLRARESGPK
jgi:ankyrin repeat protein